jgi:hypothetical protein
VTVRPLREVTEVLAVWLDVRKRPYYVVDTTLLPWVRIRSRFISTFQSVAIVIRQPDSSPVVQFANFHMFSIRNSLTSDRLAIAGRIFSSYKLRLQVAHIVLAQAFLDVHIRPGRKR